MDKRLINDAVKGTDTSGGDPRQLLQDIAIETLRTKAGFIPAKKKALTQSFYYAENIMKDEDARSVSDSSSSQIMQFQLKHGRKVSLMVLGLPRVLYHLLTGRIMVSQFEFHPENQAEEYSYDVKLLFWEFYDAIVKQKNEDES